jgi:hypothetical protein
MTDPTRRELIAGASLTGLATLSDAHASALSAGGAMAARAAQLRARWEQGAEDLSATLLVDRPDCGDPTLRTDADTLRRGFAALEVFKEIELLSIEEQAHRPIQRLLGEVFVAVGAAVVTAASWARSWSDGAGLDADPDDGHLHGALGALRLGVRDAKTTYGRQQQLETSLAELAGDRRPGALRQRVRRLLHRTGKAHALAERIAEDPTATGVLQLDDPALHARVVAAQEATGEPVEDFARTYRKQKTLLVLGMLGLGAVIVAGGFFALVGLCVVGCGGGVGGVVLLLISLGVMGLAIWGIIGLRDRYRAVKRKEENLRSGQSDADATPRTPLASAAWVDIDASLDWVSAGVVVRADEPLVARAWGVIRGGRLWAADAEGDGVAAGPGAPLPGAPARALIGRIGGRVFFIGAEQRVPDGLEGPLELGVNVADEHRALLRGGFTVQLMRPALPA